MRLQASKSVHYDSGPNMTPLVDVVMVILIFLMLAGSFGAAAHFLPNQVPIRPDAVAGTGRGTLHAPSLDLFVRSAPEGGFIVRLGGGETYHSAAALMTVLREKRVAHEAAGSSPNAMQVTIRPRLNTRHEDLMAVYQAAMDAQWPRIGFAAARD